MHPSWQRSEPECRVVMIENDQRFMEGRQEFTSRCRLGRLPSCLEDGEGRGVNSRHIKACSRLGDMGYREGPAKANAERCCIDGNKNMQSEQSEQGEEINSVALRAPVVLMAECMAHKMALNSVSDVRFNKFN